MNDIKIKKIESNILSVVLNPKQKLVINKNLMTNFCLEGRLDFVKEKDWVIYPNTEGSMYFGLISFNDKKIHVQAKIKKNEFLTVICPNYSFVRLMPKQKIRVILPAGHEYKLKTELPNVFYANYQKENFFIYDLVFNRIVDQNFTTLHFNSNFYDYFLNVVFEKNICQDVSHLHLPLFRDVNIKEMPWVFPESSQWNWLRYDREKSN